MDDTKERILSAALDVFSVKGYAASRTREIAVAAGMNEVTLFRTFGSKRNLYIAVFRRYAITATEETILSGLVGDPHADLLTIARSIASLFVRNVKIVHMSIKDMDSFPEINAELKRQPDAMIALVASFFRQASGGSGWHDDPERLARVFVTSLMGTVLHLKRFKTEREVYDFVAEFAEILWRGMSAGSHQPTTLS